MFVCMYLLVIYTHGAQANSAFHTFGVGKWVAISIWNVHQQHRHWLTIPPAPTIRNLFRHIARYKCSLLTYLLTGNTRY